MHLTKPVSITAICLFAFFASACVSLSHEQWEMVESSDESKVVDALAAELDRPEKDENYVERLTSRLLILERGYEGHLDNSKRLLARYDSLKLVRAEVKAKKEKAQQRKIQEISEKAKKAFRRAGSRITWRKIFPNIKKSEFETQEAYNKRLPAFDSVSSYFLHVPLEYGSYDIDKGRIKLKVEAELLCKETALREKCRSVVSVPMDLSNVKKSSYVGTNAFGAKTRVLKESGLAYYFVPTNWWKPISNLGTSVEIKKSFVDGEFLIEMPMSPDKARKVKSNSVKLMAGFGAQYCGRGDSCTMGTLDKHEPTRSIPLERNIFIMGAKGRLESIIIYEKRNQKILDVVVDKFQVGSY